MILTYCPSGGHHRGFGAGVQPALAGYLVAGIARQLSLVVPAGFEPASSDRESEMLTATPRDHWLPPRFRSVTARPPSGSSGDPSLLQWTHLLSCLVNCRCLYFYQHGHFTNHPHLWLNNGSLGWNRTSKSPGSSHRCFRIPFGLCAGVPLHPRLHVRVRPVYSLHLPLAGLGSGLPPTKSLRFPRVWVVHSGSFPPEGQHEQPVALPLGHEGIK